MDIQYWILLVSVAGFAVAIGWWKRHARRMFVIDHVRVELHPPCVVDDKAIEVVWRAAISMTNISRRPRMLPVLAERATVRAGRRVYLARVALGAESSEVNPGEVALAWVEYVLPAASRARLAELLHLVAARRPRSLRFRWR